MITNRMEALGATAATAGSLLVDLNGYLQLAIGLSTLAWWLRLWCKNPNIKPPK